MRYSLSFPVSKPIPVIATKPVTEASISRGTSIISSLSPHTEDSSLWNLPYPIYGELLLEAPL